MTMSLDSHRTPLLPRLLLALFTLAFVPSALPQDGAGDNGITRSRGSVTLNFVNAEIESVSKAIAVMIGRNIVVDPRVKGQITVVSDQPQSVRDAYQSFQAALRGLGFAVVEGGGLLKVLPEADAKLQTSTVSIGEVGVRGDQVITQIFQLRFENPNNLVAVLRPLISANNTINASPATNSLVITDYADNLQRLAKIIAALDMPASTDVEVIALKHAVASDVAPLVQRLTDGAGGGLVVPGAVGIGGGGATSVLADARSNSLIVRAPNASRLATLRSLVAKLDVPSAGIGPGGGMWVVHLKNADAVKLATVVRAAFAAIGTGSTGSGGSGAGGAPISTAAQAPVALASGQSAATAPIAASAQPSTGGFIQADPATNSLIITAPEPLYRQVRAMIEQLDTRRAQVYIESLIVEVSGDNIADFGFQWQGLIGKDGNKNIGVIGTNLAGGRSPSIVDINTGAVAGQVNIGSGLNIGLVHNFAGKYALAAIANFLQTQGNSNIMSTPNLMTVDNEEAKIVVGRNVPFITGQFTSTGTGTTNPFQTIERKDVGLTLRIKPQIGEGGTVRMTIFQESSDVIGQAQGTSGTGPTTSKRSIESNVIVDDGSILVLGGLIEDRYDDSSSKVPLLGDIPGLGALFRSESRTKKRTNLMVFLRPVVVRTTEDANKISLDRYDLIRARQSDEQPRQSSVLPINESPILPPLEQPTSPTPPPPMKP
jgi:general secretion pathway protein D